MQQKLIFFLLVFTFFVSGRLCSQQSNPFDIKNRSELVREVSPEPEKVKDELINIEVVSTEIPEEEVGIETKEQAQNADTLLETLQQKKIEIEDMSFLEKRQQDLISQNPFNVSHIPVKRKKKETATAQNTHIIKGESVENEEPTVDKKGSVDEEWISNQLRNISSNKFIFWLFLIQLLLVTSVLSINRDFINKIIRSITNDNFAKLVSRDSSGGYDSLFLIMYLLFTISLSIFVYLCLQYFYNYDGFQNFFIVFLAVTAIYGVRHIFQNVSGFIFPFKKTSEYYDFMIILFNSLLGLILIPVNVVATYAVGSLSSFAIYTGIVFMAILYLLRFLRGGLHAYTYIRNYLFHFFLYLCTCEFAPVLILVKFLSKSFIH